MLVGRSERCPSSSAHPCLALRSWGLYKWVLLLEAARLKCAAPYKSRRLQALNAAPSV